MADVRQEVDSHRVKLMPTVRLRKIICKKLADIHAVSQLRCSNRSIISNVSWSTFFWTSTGCQLRFSALRLKMAFLEPVQKCPHRRVWSPESWVRRGHPPPPSTDHTVTPQSFKGTDHIVALPAERLYCIDFLRAENQSFRNKSDKTQPIRTKFSIRGQVNWAENVQGSFGAIGPFWSKWGLGRVPRSPSFFCLVNHATFQELCNHRFSPNLVTKRSSVSHRWIPKDIFENFHFRGNFPPKSDIEIRSNRHLTQNRLQVTGCPAERYCLLHVVVQGPGSFRGRSTFCMTYGCGATGRQTCPIFGFWPIFSTQKS